MFNHNKDSEAPQKVALYARVSSEDQVDRETIQNQVQMANAICPALGKQLVQVGVNNPAVHATSTLPW